MVSFSTEYSGSELSTIKVKSPNLPYYLPVSVGVEDEGIEQIYAFPEGITTNSLIQDLKFVHESKSYNNKCYTLCSSLSIWLSLFLSKNKYAYLR